MFLADVAMGDFHIASGAWGGYPVNGSDSTWAKGRDKGGQHSGVIDGGVERGAVPTPLGGQVARTSIFTTLPALSKRRPFFDSGRRTENFVGLIQRSNASYLSEINKFNATAGGAIGPR